MAQITELLKKLTIQEMLYCCNSIHIVICRLLFVVFLHFCYSFAALIYLLMTQTNEC